MVKKDLLDFLKENDKLDQSDPDATADVITDLIDAVRTLQRYEEIIKTQNNRVIGHTGKQGQLLKRFRKIEQFLENLGQNKPTFNFLKKYRLNS